MRAGNTHGEGEWSNSLTFVVATNPPRAPTLGSPRGDIDQVSPTYHWNTSTGASSYQLWINDASGNVFNGTVSAANAGCAAASSSCALTPDLELALGKGKWWVRALSQNGASPWSSGADFTVTAPVPDSTSLLAPRGSIDAIQPTFSWTATEHATWYLVLVYDARDRTVLRQWIKAADIGCAAAHAQCDWIPEQVVPQGSARWWVRTWGPGGMGPWSASASFNNAAGAPAAATLVAPSGAVSSSGTPFVWNSVRNATWYYLWISDTRGNVHAQWYSAASAGCASGTGRCSVTPSVSLANGGGRWWIRTWNAVGVGEWSQGQQFTISGGRDFDQTKQQYIDDRTLGRCTGEVVAIVTLSSGANSLRVDMTFASQDLDLNVEEPDGSCSTFFSPTTPNGGAHSGDVVNGGMESYRITNGPAGTYTIRAIAFSAAQTASFRLRGHNGQVDVTSRRKNGDATVDPSFDYTSLK